MSHQREPWKVGGEVRPGICRIEDVDGRLVAVVHGDSIDGTATEGSVETRRRIVACVNACRGIPTEYIEGKQVHLLIESGDLLMNGTHRDHEAFAAEYLRAHGYTITPPEKP